MTHRSIDAHIIAVVNVNVNVYVYSLDIPSSSADCTILRPWYRNSLLYGLISSGENSAHFLQLMPFHNSPFFRSTRYPSLLGGQRQSGMRGFAQHLYTRSNFSDLRELVTLPCATICVRQTANLYQQVLHCHSGSVVSSTGRHQTATPYMPLVRQRREQRSPALGVRCLDHSTTTADC